MKRGLIFICAVMVLLALAIPAFAGETVTLDSKIEIELNAGEGKVSVTSWPWLPLLQFERYRSLFSMNGGEN